MARVWREGQKKRVWIYRCAADVHVLLNPCSSDFQCRSWLAPLLSHCHTVKHAAPVRMILS
jgi:hypothetical protein